jgi:hypothetical protein
LAYGGFSGIASEKQCQDEAADALWEDGNPDVEPGDSIAENHAAYGRMHDALNRVPGAIRTNWFGAASLVTGPMVIGAAENINGPILSDADEAYLEHVHHALAKENYENYKKLLKSELPDGIEIPADAEDPVRALDYALVEWEQQRVTELTDEYFEANPDANRDAIMDSVSRATDPGEEFQEQLRDWAMTRVSDVDTVVDEVFSPGTYDFSNPEHRVKLGKAIVDHVRAEAQGSQ